MSNDELKNVIWVNKLSKNVTENKVRDHFKDCGEIKTVFICSSRNRNSLYCFIEFIDENSAQKALEKNDSQLNEETDEDQITVALANNRLYERSVRRTDARSKLNEKVAEEIKDMDKTDTYYYGFSQGKKYMLKKMTTSNPRRNVRYIKKHKYNENENNEQDEQDEQEEQEEQEEQV